MNEFDIVKLNIYEAFETGEITSYEKDLLLEHVQLKLLTISNDIFYEAYIGKTNLLLEAEDVMNKLVAEMKVNPTADYTNHKLTKVLSQLLKKQFGFKNVFIVWKRSIEPNPSIQTYIDLDSIYLMKEKINMKTTKGYYDKNHVHTCYINLSSSIVSQIKGITGSEYLGAILHEIGHNFDISIYHLLMPTLAIIGIIAGGLYTVQNGRTYNIPSPIRVPRIDIDNDTIDMYNPVFQVDSKIPIDEIKALLQTTSIGKKILYNVNKIWDWILSKVPIVKNIIFEYNKILDVIYKLDNYNIIRELKNFKYTMQYIGNLAINAPKELLTKATIHSVIRKEEQFADSFATMYGYGTEVISFLNKIDNIHIFDDDRLSIFNDIILTLRYLYTVLDGTHGTNLDRLNDNIAYLKTELKSSDLPPKIKNDIANQIKSMENIRDKMLNANKDQKLILTCTTRLILDKITMGDTNILAALYPDNYA